MLLQLAQDVSTAGPDGEEDRSDAIVLPLLINIDPFLPLELHHQPTICSFHSLRLLQLLTGECRPSCQPRLLILVQVGLLCPLQKELNHLLVPF